MSRMFVFSASDIGSRKTQQDDYYVCESSDNKNVIGIVADGMGGAVAGHVASQEVVSVVKQILNGRSAVEVDLLVSIVNKANARIKELGIKHPDYQGMGTTCLLFAIANNTLNWVSVGDSPLFLFRDNVIHRLNEDHSLTPYLDQLLAFGKINKDEYQTDARHNQVTSVLMGEDIPKIDVCNDGFQLLDGDILLAASDGLETLPPDAIADMCSNNGNSSIATLLIDAVIDCGARHQDNTTVIAVKV